MKIENSYNLGNITCTGASANGGVVGMTTDSRVENCYNAGIITGNMLLGGIVGENQNNSIIKKCYNKY